MLEYMSKKIDNKKIKTSSKLLYESNSKNYLLEKDIFKLMSKIFYETN